MATWSFIEFLSTDRNHVSEPVRRYLTCNDDTIAEKVLRIVNHLLRQETAHYIAMVTVNRDVRALMYGNDIEIANDRPVILSSRPQEYVDVIGRGTCKNYRGSIGCRNRNTSAVAEQAQAAKT